MPANNFDTKGLTNEQVLIARKKYGNNQLDYKKENGFLEAIKSLAKEPMIILLLVASFIYFISGDTGDGIFLASAIVLIAIISLYQNSRSRNALEKLKNFTQPNCKVIRDGKVEEIKSEDLVVGDSLMIEEGTSITADGIIVHSNDFSVNESILTGESLSVYKDHTKVDNLIYRGTTVASGLAIATITAIGNETKLGKIGKSLESIKEEKTPLELQINNFVKKMVIAGSVVFVIVWAINYFRSYNVLDSLLKALTLAMSILPEEIPVAFTSFMALGAWRLMKMGIVVKQMKTVETLGSATVICTDKTGTITENKMSLAKLFALASQKITNPNDALNDAEKLLIKLSMWASEPIPFDPMEVALHMAYIDLHVEDERPNFKLIHEYPLGGKPPMMTHIFEDKNCNRIIARMFPEAKLKIINALKALQQIVAMTGDGVNDGPALKAAHIGIAMGKKGTEIAKQAASLILTEDDLSKMVDAVAMGRRIYGNLKKAIQYIISIHIPSFSQYLYHWLSDGFIHGYLQKNRLIKI